MTAVRVISDHTELDNVGTISHANIDGYLNTTDWVIVSGSPGPFPPSARRLVAGSGCTLTDTGPGGALIITSTPTGTGTFMSWMEVPVGSADGINRDFTLAHAPIPQATLMFFVNGVLQMQGSLSDYVLTGSGNTVHVNYAYHSGSNLFATYPY